MSPRLKKLLSLFILLPGLLAYIIAAITIADFIPANKILQIIYFAGAGIIWIFPLKPLFKWINSPAPEPRSKAGSKHSDEAGPETGS